MYWRVAAAFVAGFALAITLVVEIGTPWAFVVFISGFVSKSLLALAIKWIWGANLGTLWRRYFPEAARYWRHALAYATGRHPELDPLICNHCRG